MNMATKRRHVDDNDPSEDDRFDDTHSGDLSNASLPPARSPGGDEAPTPKPSAKYYPRKRVAIACDFCRLRKTRCDATKPSCSFCIDSGVDCRYRGAPKPGEPDKPKEAPGPSAEAFSQLERRLANLEAKLRFGAGVENGNFTSILSPVSPHNNTLHQQHQPQMNHGYSSNRYSTLLPPSDSTYTSKPVVSSSFRQTQSEAMTARPSFLTFGCPPFIDGESWDDTSRFYDDEMAAGEILFSQSLTALQEPPDFFKKTTRHLEQNFVRNFLRWIPIFDLSACVQYVNDAFTHNFSPTNPSSCLALFIFAIGAISDANTTIHSSADSLPGMAYLARGNQLLDGLSLLTGDVTVLQCRILQASYYQMALRPLQAWNSIVQASRDVMHMLSSTKKNHMDASVRDVLHRVFWACSIVHHGLEAVLKMHPIGLREFHDIVPLPLSDEEETGFYYFLAQASLRRILTETLDVVGYHTGTVIHAPIVTHEIQSQVQSWYEHLPPTIRFPLDASPLFDPRTSFLRTQYAGLLIVTRWESVLRVLAAPSPFQSSSPAPVQAARPPPESKSKSTPLGAPVSSTELSRLRSEAAECINSCMLCLSTAEETLCSVPLLLSPSNPLSPSFSPGTQRTQTPCPTLATQFVLWSSFASLAALIITWQVPAMAYVPATRENGHILRGYEMLKGWEGLSLVKRGLARARSLARRRGLELGS